MKVKKIRFSVCLTFTLFIFFSSQETYAQASSTSKSPMPENLWLTIALIFFIAFLISSFLYLRTGNQLIQEIKNKEALVLHNPLSDRNEELSQILHRISHDLKEFLVNIEELTHIALLESENSPINEYLHMQLEVLDKTKLLLFRIMEIERIRNHQSKKKRIELKGYLKNIVRSMRRIDGGRNIDILLDIPENLTLQSDADMLEIVFDNLIINTIEHNHPSQKPLRMTIRGQESQQFIRITLSDNGRGILEEHREKIFELFVLNLNKKLGFGLGLYKTKLALEKVGGQIQLLPSESDETVFQVTLPKL